MASVCFLTRDHDEAQREHLEQAHSYMRDMMLFDDENQLDLGLTLVPSEGHVVEGTEDAFALFSAYHDVIPHECLPIEEHELFHNGSERNAYIVGTKLRMILEEQGLSEQEPPPRHEFTIPVSVHGVEHEMPIRVVNYVNTSYWRMDRYSKHPSPVLLPHRFMWRRLAHMGCQVNHVRTSIKICYAWPWNASELISHPGRILETGSDNPVTADLMFYEVTLRHFQLAGMPNLYVYNRSLRNVVTTMALPIENRLILALLYHLLHAHMKTKFDPGLFAGLIVRHPDFNKVRALIFAGGALVIVGTNSEEQTIAALQSLIQPILKSEDSVENRATLAKLGPEIQRMCDMNQKVVSRKRVASSGQLVPSGASKKSRRF